MELAIIRYAVVCQGWNDFSSGYTPHLPAFLAGWFMREIDPDSYLYVGQFKDSFRAGWSECDTMKAIQERETE